MSDSKVKFLIVGRTGSGKDYLKKTLQDAYKWNFVNSMTTRKPRFEGEDTHIFLTEDEAKQYDDKDKVAKTIINNNEYFATKQQVEECDAYIIDPDGIETLLNNMPNTWFEIIYIQADDDAKRKEMAINRADDTEQESIIFDERNHAEDSQFEAFEHLMTNGSYSKENCHGIHKAVNDFTEETMENIAITLEMRRRFYKHMRQVLTTLIEAKYIEYDKTHDTILLYNTSSDYAVPLKTEKFIQLLAEEPKESMFAKLMESFLFTRDSYKTDM